MRGTAAAIVEGTRDLVPYVPQLLHRWTPTSADDRHLSVTGSLVFVDVSGFTRLTERLARRGKVGAEEMSDLLSHTFADLLAESYEDGADLVKWGGDAMLLLFQGSEHARRAARAAHRMRARLRVVGRLATSQGKVALRMSVGIHSGEFDFFLVGDPDLHRELLICGPAATITADTEAAAAAGQIGLSAATAALLDASLLGAPLGDGRLLRSVPPRTTPPGDGDVDRTLDPGRLLPPPIRELLLEGVVEPEHRLVTVAFLEYSGTDRVLRSSGATGLADALDEMVRGVQHACADHDVTFFETDISRDGGKIMLTAGAPRSSEHDEERMLRLARAVLDRGGTLPLRIGVNRGHVFSGDFGAPFRRTYSVKGDAVNLAARVMSRAQPGQALATLEVLGRSQSAFRTRELPPFQVRGRSQAVRAAEVGELLGTRADPAPTVPVLGRDHEQAVLEQAVQQVRAGHGQLVQVVGEAGLGKSRLVSLVLSGRDDLHVVTAPCEQYESLTPYFPFRRLLRDLLAVPGDAGPEQVAELLAQRVSAVAPRLVPWLPLLGVPMDVRLPPTRETAELDQRFRKERLESLVTELLGAILDVPTAVVFEDSHLMDVASADLLERLTEQLEDRALLVLVTRREDGAGFVPRADVVASTVRLQPLTSGAALELVRAMQPGRPLTPQAAAELVDRSGGNPLFLEALLLEAGRTESVAELPQSVEGLVTSQIDRLNPGDRTVVRYAAVFGTVVDERALDLLLEHHGAQVPSGAMQRLAEFLDRDAHGQLRFRNALIRDAAYEGLPFSRRKTLHDQVGQALERASAEPESQCELLSLHFFHAGRPERAWRYSVLAGEQAVAKYAHGAAIEFFTRAVQSASQRRGVDPYELAAVYEQLADSRWLVGLTDEAAHAYAAARACVRGDPVRLAGILEKETRIDQRRRRHTVALRRISLGLNRLRDVPGSSAAVARSLLARRYAHSRFSQGRIDEALHWAEVAAYEAEEAAGKDALAQAYEMLNFVYASTGREEPLPYGKLALQAYLELGNLPRQGHCLNNLAMQEYGDGRWVDSLSHLRQASDIFRRIGDAAAEANALYNRVELLVRQGRPADAGDLLPDVLRIARAMEDEELVALALREQARTAAQVGDVAGALSLLDQAHGAFLVLGEQGELRTTELARVEVLLDAGLTSEAGPVLAAAAAAAEEEPEPTVARLAGRHHLAEGRLPEAGAAWQAGLDAARQTGNRFEEGLLLLCLGELARRQGAPDEAPVRQARELLASMGVVGTPTLEELGPD